VKPSRLELRLVAEIAGAPTALEADCKRAELAAYLTRLGRVDEARATLAALHQRYDSRPHVAISAWLNLVEGLVGHFGDMDPSARDKVLRSHALSTAAGLTPMRALSAAWLAQLDYLQVDVLSMSRHVTEALQLAGKSYHGARSRARLVVAQAHHLAGHLDRALPWYSRARDHAVADRDEATVSALMHNMAWLRAHDLRQRAFLELNPDNVTMHALMGAESTGNFDLLIGAVSLQSLVPVLRAQVLAATGREAEALDLYESHLSPALKEGMRRLKADLLADIAWCRLKVGQVDRAREDAFLAEASIDPAGQFDDRALAHSRLAQVFDLLERSDAAAMHRSLAAETWAGHALLQARIVEALGDLSAITAASRYPE
jgi:hypothetical protein